MRSGQYCYPRTEYSPVLSDPKGDLLYDSNLVGKGREKGKTKREEKAGGGGGGGGGGSKSCSYGRGFPSKTLRNVPLLPRHLPRRMPGHLWGEAELCTAIINCAQRPQAINVATSSLGRPTFVMSRGENTLRLINQFWSQCLSTFTFG